MNYEKLWKDLKQHYETRINKMGDKKDKPDISMLNLLYWQCGI